MKEQPAKALLQQGALLGDRSRLAIMALLASRAEPVQFSELLETLELSKGNLASHLRRLEEGGMLSVLKQFVDRKPRTTYRPTEAGRRELLAYMRGIEELLRKIRK